MQYANSIPIPPPPHRNPLPQQRPIFAQLHYPVASYTEVFVGQESKGRECGMHTPHLSTPVDVSNVTHRQRARFIARKRARGLSIHAECLLTLKFDVVLALIISPPTRLPFRVRVPSSARARDATLARIKARRSGDSEGGPQSGSAGDTVQTCWIAATDARGVPATHRKVPVSTIG